MSERKSMQSDNDIRSADIEKDQINRGWLKYGNKPGDPSKAPRCGARRKYDGQPCQAPAMKNGRCRLHGGKSTGPKRARLTKILKALESKHSIDQDREIREFKQVVESFIDALH